MFSSRGGYVRTVDWDRHYDEMMLGAPISKLMTPDDFIGRLAGLDNPVYAPLIDTISAWGPQKYATKREEYVRSLVANDVIFGDASIGLEETVINSSFIPRIVPSSYIESEQRCIRAIIEAFINLVHTPEILSKISNLPEYKALDALGIMEAISTNGTESSVLRIDKAVMSAPGPLYSTPAKTYELNWWGAAGQWLVGQLERVSCETFGLEGKVRNLSFGALKAQADVFRAESGKKRPMVIMTVSDESYNPKEHANWAGTMRGFGVDAHTVKEGELASRLTFEGSEVSMRTDEGETTVDVFYLRNQPDASTWNHPVIDRILRASVKGDIVVQEPPWTALFEAREAIGLALDNAESLTSSSEDAELVRAAMPVTTPLRGHVDTVRARADDFILKSNAVHGGRSLRLTRAEVLESLEEFPSMAPDEADALIAQEKIFPSTMPTDTVSPQKDERRKGKLFITSDLLDFDPYVQWEWRNGRVTAKVVEVLTRAGFPSNVQGGGGIIPVFLTKD